MVAPMERVLLCCGDLLRRVCLRVLRLCLVLACRYQDRLSQAKRKYTASWVRKKVMVAAKLDLWEGVTVFVQFAHHHTHARIPSRHPASPATTSATPHIGACARTQSATHSLTLSLPPHQPKPKPKHTHTMTRVTLRHRSLRPRVLPPAA
jgi:hypothetical protein